MRRTALSVVIAVTVTLALILVACTNPPAGPLKLTKADSGSTQNLATDQELRVTLDSNQTTGYQWAIDGQLPAQLEQVGAPTYSTSSQALGAGGTEVWTFRGKATGTGELRMKYWRSFEPTAQPADTFSVTVTVK